MKVISKKFCLLIIPIILLFNFSNLIAQPPSTPMTPMATANGTVLSTVKSGDTIYISGSFMVLKNPDGGIVLRNFIASIDARTGYVTSWNPNSDGPVLSMSISGNILYVGGAFTNIGGKARNNIAALKTDTDINIANDWNPNAADVVTKVFVTGTKVYCAGSFTGIAGQSRYRLAAITTMMNENNAEAWNPAPNGTVNDFIIIGTKMYVAGSFFSIGGQNWRNLAEVKLNDGLATAWNPNPNNAVMAITSFGNTLYAVGNFSSIGGQTRVRIAALDMLVNTNNATPWYPIVNGTINTIKAWDGRIYIGGNFSLVNGITRNYIASMFSSQNIDNTTPWYPVLDNFVERINIQDSIIYIGGQFNTINSQERTKFAMFKPVLPSLTTNNISNITVNSSLSGGNIIADGGPSVIRRGICWSINPNPTIDDDTTVNGNGTGGYTSILNGLSVYTNYKVRAYATNSLGTSYGNQISFYTYPAVYTGSIASIQLCEGDSIIVPFEASPGFEVANHFIAQLSDYLGSFENSVILDSIQGKESGEIHVQIPIGTTYGINYRFRVVATQPSATLKDNGIDIQINELPEVILNNFPDVCDDFPLMDLTGGTPPGGIYSGKGVINNQFDASVAGHGSHTITYTYSDGFGCANKAETTIRVNKSPNVSLQLQSDICIEAQSVNLTGGTPPGGIYSGNGVTGTTFYPNTAGIGKHKIIYNYSDPNGCSSSDSAEIDVNPLPIVTLAPLNSVCLNSESFPLSGGNPAGGEYTGTGVINNVFDPKIAGVGTHVIQYTYTDDKGCTDDTTNTIAVKFIPSKPVITQSDYRTLTSSSEYDNQWYLDGTILPNDTSKLIHPKATGSYTVQVNGNNGCFSDLSDEFIFKSLGVNDINSNDNISIYPNPAGNEIYIQFKSELITQISISLNNLLGERILTKVFQEIETDKIEKINTQLLLNGIYIINFSIGNETFNRKIIIQK